MKTSQFNGFIEYVRTADMNDPVWWAGYMWIDMTEKQSNRMYDMLKARGMEKDGLIEMPSGLKLARI